MFIGEDLISEIIGHLQEEQNRTEIVGSAVTDSAALQRREPADDHDLGHLTREAGCLAEGELADLELTEVEAAEILNVNGCRLWVQNGVTIAGYWAELLSPALQRALLMLDESVQIQPFDEVEVSWT